MLNRTKQGAKSGTPGHTMNNRPPSGFNRSKRTQVNGWHWGETRLVIEQPQPNVYEIGVIEFYCSEFGDDYAGMYLPIRRYTTWDEARRRRNEIRRLARVMKQNLLKFASTGIKHTDWLPFTTQQYQRYRPTRFAIR